MIDRECTNCNLHHHRRQVVQGRGQSENPTLFIIDEAPDSQSDIDGLAASGGMGRVLYQILNDAGISLSSCYIRNVVACRPPNGRVPEVEELMACRESILEDIKRTGATKVLALGDEASIIMTGKRLVDMEKKRPIYNRGYVQDFGTFKITSTYTPTILMKNPELWSVFINDVKKLFKIFPVYEERFEYNPSPERLREVFNSWRDQPVAVDIETDGPDDLVDVGLDPFNPQSMIVGIAFCGEPGHAIQLSQPYLNQEWLVVKGFLENHTQLVYQNNTFDRLFLKCKGIDSRCYWDTLDGGHINDSRLPKSLDFFRSLYTNDPPYKTKTNYGENLAWLNCKDVHLTLIVHNEQKKFIKPKLMTFGVNKDSSAMGMRYRGVKVNTHRVAEYYSELKPKVESLASAFYNNYGVSISSPKQLQKFLFQDLGFSIPIQARKGKNGGLSTDEEVIEVLLKKCIGETKEKQILLDILEYRGLAKTVSTYCEGLFSCLTEDDIIHPPWDPTGTDTERMSCKKPNMLNVPEWMRDIFIPREGKVFYGADFSGMQIWGAAITSRDAQLIEVLLDPKRKIHREVEAAINAEYPLTQTMIERLGEEKGKAQSYLAAKSVVFGTFFGRTPADIAKQFFVPVSVAQGWQDAFFFRFPIMGAMFVRLEADWKRQGYTEGLWGHRKYSRKSTEAKNFPIQNFEALVVCNALHELEKKGFSPVIYVYDQVVCEEPEGVDRYEEFEHILRTSSPDIYPDFPVVGKMGMNWKECK